MHYIAYEPNMTEEMAALFDQLSAELGLQRVDLSNLSSLSQQQKEENKDYLSIMTENLDVLESMMEEDPNAVTQSAQTTETTETTETEATAE